MPAAEVVILDVGHGNCGLVFEPGATSIIDAPNGDTHVVELLARGITTINAVLISHADRDHCGGLLTLLLAQELRVARVLLNTDSTKDTVIWDEVLRALGDARTRTNTTLEVGLTTSTRAVGEGHTECQLEVLAPEPTLAAKGPGSQHNGRTVLSNTASAVIRVKIDGTPAVLFAGDIDSFGLDVLLAAKQDLSAPVLVFPHHGGSPGSVNAGEFAERLCNAVKPQCVVFSLGRSHTETPREDIVAGVRRAIGAGWIACTQLSTKCSAVVPTGPVNHLQEATAKGRNNRACCAGSISVRLVSGKVVIAPSVVGHAAFVDANAPTALCRR